MLEGVESRGSIISLHFKVDQSYCVNKPNGTFKLIAQDNLDIYNKVTGSVLEIG